MARGVFTNVIPNGDLTVSGTGVTDAVNIGSEVLGQRANSGLNSVGSVSVQFTTSADMTITPYVRSDDTVPYVALDTTVFETLPAGPTFAAGTHIVQFTLPVCSWVYFEFGGTGDVTAIRTNVQ